MYAKSFLPQAALCSTSRPMYATVVSHIRKKGITQMGTPGEQHLFESMGLYSRRWVSHELLKRLKNRYM